MIVPPHFTMRLKTKQAEPGGLRTLRRVRQYRERPLTSSRGRLLMAHVKSSWLLFSGGAVAQLGARLDGIEEVVGSNPIGSTKSIRSGPDTWVTERTGYIGNNLGPNGFSSGSSTRVSRSKYPRS